MATEAFGRLFGEKIATKIADGVMRRLEDENALPLPERAYDVVVDDPSLSGRWEVRYVYAVSARSAAVQATRLVYRAEGWRCMVAMPRGDEQTVEGMAREGAMYATAHAGGKHPDMDYSDGAAGPRGPLAPAFVRRVSGEGITA